MYIRLPGCSFSATVSPDSSLAHDARTGTRKRIVKHQHFRQYRSHVFFCDSEDMEPDGGPDCKVVTLPLQARGLTHSRRSGTHSSIGVGAGAHRRDPCWRSQSSELRNREICTGQAEALRRRTWVGRHGPILLTGNTIANQSLEQCQIQARRWMANSGMPALELVRSWFVLRMHEERRVVL